MLTKMLVTNKSWKRFLFLVVCEMCKVGQDGTHFEDSKQVATDNVHEAPDCSSSVYI